MTLVVHEWGSGLGFDWANRHRGAVEGIHFVQEDSPGEIGAALRQWIENR